MKKCVQLARVPKDKITFGTEPTLRDFEKSIGKDIDFIQGILGDVTDEPLKFKLITPKLDNPIFMFHFECSTSFSSVSSEVMAQLFDIVVDNGTVEDCDTGNHKSHAFLWPFFCDNKGLKRLKGGDDVKLLQAELAAAESTNKPRLPNTPFTTGAHPKGATWPEDVWTQRLGNALTQYIGNHWNVTIGVDVQFEDIQTLCSGLNLVNSKHLYLFSGKPDVLLCQMPSDSPQGTAVINIDAISNENESARNENESARNEEESDELQTTVVIENKKKEMTMIQMQGCIIPKMLGQLLSSLHFILATKFIRMAVQGNYREMITVRGLLIQKSVGCYLCEVRLTLATDDNGCTPEFTVISPDDTSPVTCQSLCANIGLLCNGV